MFESCHWYSKHLWTKSAWLFVILLAGCGYAEYETRLNESRKYYAYLERIESSLSPKWVSGAVMDLRVPRQFGLIPAPQSTVLPDGTVEEPTSDPRQPNYVNIKLPGLFGAWQSVFMVSSPEGREESKGYIYALSNYDKLVGPQASEAAEFIPRIKELLARSLKVEGKDGTPEIFPPGIASSQYQKQLTYDVCRFSGAVINKMKYTFELYHRDQNPVVGAILVVLPDDMELAKNDLERVTNRIPMMLASFNFSKTPPRVGGSGGPAGQPSPAANGF